MDKIDTFKPIFKATMENGNISVNPIIERKGKDLIIHIPSLNVITETKRKWQADYTTNLKRI